jgi:hypothetical protein
MAEWSEGMLALVMGEQPKKDGSSSSKVHHVERFHSSEV